MVITHLDPVSSEVVLARFEMNPFLKESFHRPVSSFSARSAPCISRRCGCWKLIVAAEYAKKDIMCQA